MAKYQNSMFGKIVGEQAGVVGSSWKGINYIRRYVIPANPQTAAQQTQRSKFKNVSQFGRRLVDSILNTYWLPKPKGKSPFNDFVGRNVKLQTSDTMDYSEVKLAFGSLYNPSIASESVDTDNNTVTVNWDTTLNGEAKADDIAVVLLYDKNKDEFILDTSHVRSDGQAVINVDFAGGNVFLTYLFFVDSAKTKASESVNITSTFS